MDEASIIKFDDEISAFNGIVAVTTRDERLFFHTVRAREDKEEPPFARRVQARWIILSPCFATLSSRPICVEHTGQISFSYAMEPRYRLMATGRRRTKGLRISTYGEVRAAVRRPRADVDALEALLGAADIRSTPTSGGPCTGWPLRC
jgi:hypothetical protein